MTTLQLAQRLLRYLTIKDLGLLPADDTLHLLDAMNGAIQEYYVLVPSAYKRTTLSGMLKGPQAVTAGFVHGTNTFTGWTADVTQYGSTIAINSDARQNTIIGPNLLQDVYTGVTGSQGATVYGDVLILDQVIQRLTANPINVETGQVLMRNENFKMRGAVQQWGEMSWYYIGTGSARRIGAPRFYWVEPIGQSQGGVPPFVMRVDKLPDRDYRFRVEGDLAPYQITFQDLTVPRALPLDGFTVESCVLPLAAERLTDSPLWQNKDLLQVVLARAQSGREMSKDRPSNQAAPSNFVFTPGGF